MDYSCLFMLLSHILVSLWINLTWFFIVMQEMIDEADRDGDGEVNEQEFLRIMKKTSLY